MNRRLSLTSLFVGLLGTVAGPALAQNTTGQNMALTRGPALLSSAEIADVRAHPERFAAVLKTCDAKINYQPRPLASLNPQNHYTSTGTAEKSTDDQSLSNDATMSYRLALCYLVTQKPDYAASSQRILDAWAGTLKQVTTLQGRDNVNFNLPYMILAASWVRGAVGWDSTSFDTFLRQTVLPLSLAANPNNHGLWAVLMEASAGAYLGDAPLLAKARSRWQAILMGAIDASGQMPREITRSDTSDYHGGATRGIKGLAYTHYSLLPASMAARIFAVTGQPVWETPAGQRLAKAYAQAAAWTRHPATFPYYKSNGGKLTGVNNAAYFALLQQVYPNQDASAVLQSANVGMNGFYLLELFGK